MKKKIGIYNPYLSTRGGGEKVCLSMAEYLANDKGYDVHLIAHEKIKISDIAQYFNLNLGKVKLDVLNPHKKIKKIIDIMPLPYGVRVILHDALMVGVLKKQSYDIFINNCYQSNLPNVGNKGIYMCMFPQKIKFKDENLSILKKIYKYSLSILDHLLVNRHRKHAIYSYDLITANSKYTQKYIKKYWDVDSEILYPICEDMLIKGSEKKKIILNVGRFFGLENNAHHKRQDALVDAFKKMKDLHAKGWELHLAGSAGEDASTQKFLVKLMEESQGYPIYFHTNSPFIKIKELFNDATIYWHATGFGSNPEEYPEKQEHFGITTVEAMSAKAIPVVINSAGQSEIIAMAKNGFLWDNLDELMKYTFEAISTGAEYKNNIRTSFKKYDKKAFGNCIKNILKNLE